MISQKSGTFLGVWTKLGLATIHFVMSVRLSVFLSVLPHWITRLPRYLFSRNLIFLEHLSRKLKFHDNMTRITGTLREEQYTFMIRSRSVLLKMKKFQKKYTETKTAFIFSNLFRKIVSFWYNLEKYDRFRQATFDSINGEFTLPN